MSDAKLTADIVIKFNKESLQFFNQLVKTSEKSLRKFETVTAVVFDQLGKVNKKAMQSAIDAGKAQVKLEKSVAESAEVVAKSEAKIARATLETSKAIIQNARVLEKAKTERKENTKAVKEGAKTTAKAIKTKTDATKKEAAEDRKLAARLKRVSREKAKLTRETSKGTTASKKRSSQAKVTSKVFGELATKVAQVRVVLGLAKFAANLFVKALTIPAGVLTGWLTFLGVSARGEREVSKLARSVQVSTKFLKAFSMATKDAGLSADNAVDMLEEMSNKIGDGLETPTHGTTKAFDKLGLSLKEVQKMSRQKGLTTIMDSLVKFRKNGATDQEVVRTADEIFGGEGNKFAGYLLEMGENFSSVIEKYFEFLSVTDKTSEGMDDFYKVSERLWTTIKEIKNEGLSKEFKVWGGVLKIVTNYFKENKKEIIENIKEIGGKISDLAGKIFKIFTNKDNLKTFNKGLEITVGLVDRLANALQRSLDVVTKLRAGNTTGALLDVAGQREGFSWIKTLQSASNPPMAAINSLTSLFSGTAPESSTTNNASSKTTDNRTYNVFVRGDEMTQEEVDNMAEGIDGIEVR